MALGACIECKQRPARYTYADHTEGLCRPCWADMTGDTPWDLAQHDARNAKDYRVLVGQYVEELYADPDRAAYYASRGYSRPSYL
jgi:hypothetical protein